MNNGVSQQRQYYSYSTQNWATTNTHAHELVSVSIISHYFMLTANSYGKQRNGLVNMFPRNRKHTQVKTLHKKQRQSQSVCRGVKLTLELVTR
jgi:hypothetical protein